MYTNAVDYYKRSLIANRKIDQAMRLSEFSSRSGYSSRKYLSSEISIFRYRPTQNPYLNFISKIQENSNDIPERYVEEELKERKIQLEKYQKNINYPEQLNSLLDLGWTYVFQGRYYESIQYFQRGLDVSRKIGDRDKESRFLYALGWTYDDLGQPYKSIEYYQEALKIVKDTNNKNTLADIINGLGWVHNGLGKYEKAVELFQEQLALSEEIDSLRQKANSLNGLGWSFREMKQYRKAVSFSERALSIHTQIKDYKEIGHSLGDLGKSFSALGEHQKSMSLYNQALWIQRQVGNRWGEAIVLNDMADLMLSMNNSDLAIILYKESVNVRQAMRKDVQKLSRNQQESFTQTVAGTYRKLADLLIQQRRLAEAQAVLELLKLQELRNYTRDTSAIKGSGISLARIEQAALTEILKTFNTIGNFTQQLQDCEKTNCPTLKKLEAQRDNLNTAIQKELKTQRKLLAAHYATEGATLTPEELNNEAQRIVQNPGTVLIYPLILQDKIQFLLAFKANDGSVIFRPFETPIAATQLTNTIIEFRKQLENPSDLKTLQATSQILYNALIKPLEPELKAANIKHLVFAPDSTIRYIPLAALHDGQQYLIQRYSVSTITAASQTNTTEPSPRPIPGQKQLLAMGADHFPNTKYSNLLNVPIEIDSITATDKPGDRGIYPGTEVLNQAFSFDTIRETLKGQTYSILHLATHGAFIAGNVEESYIVPGSGPNLTGDRIDALANSNGFKNLHLVVLSACQTGVGDRASDGMEIPGISHFFLKNNVKSVLASLWNVNDASTSLFMQQFYQNLAQGMTKAQALQKIQTEFLNSKLTTNNIPRAGGRRSIPGQLPPDSLAHPYYWAPFILIGNSL